MEKGKCLVVGGSGFIGGHVAEQLVEEDYEVTVLDNFSTGRIENIPKGASIVRHDICKGLPRADYDYIFHLAAKARVQPSIQDPVRWNETNVTGTLNVLELARSVGAKVIYSSTSSVYGDTDKMPTSENCPTNPQSPYALQKLVGEMYLKLYSRLYDLDYTILRYFNVYGERQIPGGAYSAVMGIFKDQKDKSEPMTIRGDGENRRDFTYVKDVARANVMAMDWEQEVYNIGNGDNRSVNQIADYVGGERIYVDPVVEPRATLADNLKARSMGWEPTMDVERWINDNYVN